MNNEHINLITPHMSDEGYEKAFVEEAFKTNWLAPIGPNVDGFENELTEMVGIGHAAALVSATAAIHLALKNAGVDKGDIVFCQSLTFSGTAYPIAYQQATPVFIDSELGSWNMDPELLKEAFKKYKPKAVIIVHLYGISAKIDEIKEICREENTILIEDAAESLGNIYKDQWSGTFGDYGVYSFNGNKIITTSGGGMLVSNNKKGIEKAKFWATQSKEPTKHYQHMEIGYNYRMSNVSAGMGRGQLKVLEKRIEKKRQIFDTYYQAFSEIDEIIMFPETEEERATYWLTPILIHSDRVTAEMIMEKSEKENIETRPIWKPMHMQPVFKEFDCIGGKVSEEYFANGICLPSDTKMTIEDQERVIKMIKEFW